MTSQPLRSVKPDHISTVPQDRRDERGNFGPQEFRAHGVCTCARRPLEVLAWGECARCHQPVASSISKKVWADAKLREPYV